MNFRNIYMVLIAFGLYGSSLCAQTVEPGVDLGLGIYNVGFKIITLTDYGRSYDQSHGRNIPIGIWYPAVNKLGDSFMKFGEYIYAHAFEENQDEPESVNREAILNWYKQYSGHRNTTTEFINDIAAQRTNAIENAKASNDRFPLVVYSCGYDRGFHENTVLCEFLASHGFVVAMTSAQGMFAKEDDNWLLNVQGQAADVSYIINELNGLSNVDIDRVGLIGYDEGGLVSIISSLKNNDVDLVITYDGKQEYEFDQICERLPYFDGIKMNAAFVQMSAGRDVKSRKPKTHDFRFYKQTKFVDSYSIIFNELINYEFPSDHLFNYVNTGLDSLVTDLAGVNDSYRIICEMSLKFLNTYLKQNLARNKFEELSGSLKKYSSDKLVAINSRAAVEKSLNLRELFQLIENNGIDEALIVYATRLVNDPKGILSESELNGLGYHLLRSDMLDAAVKIFELNVDQNPESWNVYDSLGEAYMYVENIEKAVTSYRKSLELNPQNKNAETQIKKMIDETYKD